MPTLYCGGFYWPFLDRVSLSGFHMEASCPKSIPYIKGAGKDPVNVEGVDTLIQNLYNMAGR